VGPFGPGRFSDQFPWLGVVMIAQPETIAPIGDSGGDAGRASDPDGF
jgi:hypothetical protein